MRKIVLPSFFVRVVDVPGHEFGVGQIHHARATGMGSHVFKLVSRLGLVPRPS